MIRSKSFDMLVFQNHKTIKSINTIVWLWNILGYYNLLNLLKFMKLFN